jgi:hypothetical protein
MSEIQVANVWLSTGKTYGVLGSTADVVVIRTGSNDRLLINTTAFSVNTTLSIVGNTTFSSNVVLSGALQTISGNTNFDAGVLFVDGTNNRVGVGTTTPDANLQVVGTANVSGVSRFAANVTVATNTFTLGTSSATANGYTWLPNGILLQWGTVSANVTVGDATFPVAFPTTCFSVTANRRVAGANGFVIIAGQNTTVAQIRTANNTAVNCSYFAIGN